MKTQRIALGKKLFLQKGTVAVMTPASTDIAEGPVALSAPFRTALSMDSPLRCYPCCKTEITVGGCVN